MSSTFDSIKNTFQGNKEKTSYAAQSSGSSNSSSSLFFSKKEKNGEYADNIKSIGIGQDTNTTILFGNIYHYIVQPNSKLTFFLNSMAQDKGLAIESEKNLFAIDKDNKISGKIKFIIEPKKLNKKSVAFLKTNGVELASSNKFVYQIDLLGTRYVGALEINKKARKTKKSFKIMFTEAAGAQEIEVMSTPLALQKKLITLNNKNIIFTR